MMHWFYVLVRHIHRHGAMDLRITEVMKIGNKNAQMLGTKFVKPSQFLSLEAAQQVSNQHAT